ncbi:JAB domain-containing protein [Trichlorobacter lovleyi]|uniref:JAB domain-containing protein n=1 Tax=Trichlorobacter lovleyi TaxID=313985 RepID=UPI0023F2CE96|nr:JAB domain-containing protein [Trichlorobacter lovleyi]
MTIDTLFSTEEIPAKPRSIKFRTIRPVFETLTVKENISAYIDPKARLTQPSQIWELFRWLGRESKEYMIVLLMDGKNRLSAVDICSIGTLNQSLCHPREIFKSALMASCAAIVLLHNHPSGCTQPSSEDIAITRRLKEASEIIGIRILDHLIVSDTEYTSFVEQGLL